eukprot:176021-Amphidinium_carterae.1
MASTKGNPKGASKGPRVALPTLGGGVRLQDLVGIKAAISVPLDAITLPGADKVFGEAKTLSEYNVPRVKSVPGCVALMKAMAVLLGSQVYSAYAEGK